jgi:hypothetical protein
MYLFVDKKTQAVIHVASVSPDDDRKPGEIFRGYDPETMDVGRAPDQFIPARFAIKKGIVVDLDPPPAPAAETVAQARERRKGELTALALAARAAILPDYQLLNAGLGIYDEDRAASIKATVNAFRDEVNRLEAAIAKARSAKDLDAVVPQFPTALVVPKAGAKPARAK